MSRKRLPTDRQSVTHRVQIRNVTGGDYDLYIIVGLYPGKKPKPGELFLKIGKVGSTMRGMLDLLGLQTSLLLQNGVSLESICDKMEGTQFEPRGATDDPDIPECSSLADYTFRWLRLRFLTGA